MYSISSMFNTTLYPGIICHGCMSFTQRHFPWNAHHWALHFPYISANTPSV